MLDRSVTTTIIEHLDLAKDPAIAQDMSVILSGYRYINVKRQ